MYEAVSGNGLLSDWHQAISPIPEPADLLIPLLLWSCITHFPNCAANKDMFKLNLKYPIIWLICLLRCIKSELNWIGIERKWIELELNWKILNPIWIGIELNWKILNPAWIGIELNWKKWIDPSPDCNARSMDRLQWPISCFNYASDPQQSFFITHIIKDNSLCTDETSSLE